MQSRIVVIIAPVHDCRYPIVLDPVQKRIAPTSLHWILNPTDTIALEQALRIKDGHLNCHVTVVSVGPAGVEPALRECLAAGADEVVRIWQDGLEDCSCHQVAEILAAAIRTAPFALVLTGWRTADMELSQTPPNIAELLSIPQITCARAIEPDCHLGNIRAETRVSGRILTLSCTLPALVTVDRGPALRYPRFPDRRRAWRRPIQVLDLDDMGVAAKPDALVKVERFTPPKPRRRSTMGAITGASAAVRIQRIMAGGAQTKKESNIRSCPDRQATLKAVEYMLEEKLIVLP